MITGANGYVGRAIVRELLTHANDDDKIICLVRPQRVESEQDYWKDHRQVCVRPYDMLDGSSTLAAALAEQGDVQELVVYHVASVFGPTEDHRQTALDNVQGTLDVIEALANSKQKSQCKFILTSSMAAVRGTGQQPLNGEFYTADDWNTLSVLGENWGASYQWSKAESEKQAWEKCRQLNMPMVALCPSFVFGPPLQSSGSYSIELVGQWVRGESPVQSRLFVDVRDVALAHVAAGLREEANGNRFVISHEARISSEKIASWLRDVCVSTGLSDPSKVHFDAAFKGGAIPVGQKEVDAADALQKHLGVTVRSVKETIMDMAYSLLQETTAQV
jgi:nucleoside-diphosphate-sugar epimerase